MTTVEVLKVARELITDPSCWVTGVLSADKDGKKVFTDSKIACRFCAMGAIHRVGKDIVPRIEAERLLNDAAGTHDPDEDLMPAAYVNDKHGHAATLAMFDRAIALAEQEIA